jgi:hypothetical protein
MASVGFNVDPAVEDTVDDGSSVLLEGDIIGLSVEGDIIGLSVEGDIIGLSVEGDIIGLSVEDDIIGLSVEDDIIGLSVGFIVDPAVDDTGSSGSSDSEVDWSR